MTLRLRRICPMATIMVLACLSPATLAAGKKAEPAKSTAPTTFAPMPADHPLANIWNDPEFTKSLIGSYGFLAEVEPQLKSTEDVVFYNEKIRPQLVQDPQSLIPELKSRITADSHPQFDFILANIYFQTGDLTNAVKYFEQATTKYPKFRRAWQQLGLTWFRDSQYAAAIQPLTRAISLGSTDSKTFGLLGICYLNSEKYVSGAAAYRQAMMLEPDVVDFKLGLVKCLVALRDYDGATALLDELLEAHPDMEALWANQAMVFMQQEKYAKAAVNFEMLRRMNKASAENLATLGDVYLIQESRELALSAYLESIEKDGWQHPGRALRAAEILTGRGAWDEAKQVFQKVRQVAGSNLSQPDELKLLKLECKVSMANDQGDEAIMVLEQIIERNPLDGEALLLAGDYYARNGQPEKAEFRYDTAAKLEGFTADAFVKQAQLLVKDRKYALAVEALKKAQKANPRDNVQRYLDKVEEIARTSRS